MITALPTPSTAKMLTLSGTASDGRTYCPITQRLSPISSQKESGSAQIMACSWRSQWSVPASADFVRRTSFFSILSMRSKFCVPHDPPFCSSNRRSDYLDRHCKPHKGFADCRREFFHLWTMERYDPHGERIRHCVRGDRRTVRT